MLRQSDVALSMGFVMCEGGGMEEKEMDYTRRKIISLKWLKVKHGLLTNKNKHILYMYTDGTEVGGF